MRRVQAQTLPVSTSVLLSCVPDPCPFEVSPNTPINLTISYLPSQPTNVWLSTVVITFSNATAIPPAYLSNMTFSLMANLNPLPLLSIIPLQVIPNNASHPTTDWELDVSLAYTESRIHDGIQIGAGTFEGPLVKIIIPNGTSGGKSTGASATTTNPASKTVVIGNSSLSSFSASTMVFWSLFFSWVIITLTLS
ncbi:hypothetical protein BDEG_27959 [Batrachochytrium dendrobatidis JEL423]|uniref:Uncharacterized protein n=1 Tax=Batrachochytrium dendrobatidis (strain JEL423) TaxID=403673 RepID=A0A177WYP2_BATDL|nr:hypothetical protein BDEG_27959 [Batrachochytrium dendrobatidis JEL423]